MTETEIKEKLKFQLINFTGNGKYLKSPDLQKLIFGEVSSQHDVKIRSMFAEIVQDEGESLEPNFIYGSSTKGFQVAKTPEEIGSAIGFLIGKASQIEKEYQAELF